MIEEPLSLTIARNTAINLIAQIIPPLAAIVTLPFIVRGIGVDGYGVLSLFWVILGYSGFLELGLSRALTKFVAEYLERRDETSIPNAVWTTLIFQLILGAAVGAVLVVLSPFLIKYLNVPPSLTEEARACFYLIALLPSLIFTTASMNGLLMARARFDLVNAVQVLASVLTYSAIAVSASVLHLSLSRIVALMVGVKALAFLASLVLSMKVFPVLRVYSGFKPGTLRPLFVFGGWVAVTNALAQIITRIDRLLISSLMSVSWVTYYSVPYDALSRLWIFPASLVTTLFPTFSSLMAAHQQNRDKVEQLYVRSVKYLLLVMAPLIVFLIIFGGDILRLWVGAELAQNATRSFQILAAGMLLASLAWVPFTLLQSMGRPDLPAKFICLESIAHFVLAWWLIRRMGIEGAALAWVIRSGVDVVLHFGAINKLGIVRSIALFGNGFLRTLVMLLVLTAAMFLFSFLRGALLTRVAWAVLMNATFALVAWRYALDRLDKRPIIVVLNRFLPQSDATAR